MFYEHNAQWIYISYMICSAVKKLNKTLLWHFFCHQPWCVFLDLTFIRVNFNILVLYPVVLLATIESLSISPKVEGLQHTAKYRCKERPNLRPWGKKENQWIIFDILLQDRPIQFDGHYCWRWSASKIRNCT